MLIPGTTLGKEKINQDTYMILPNNIISENNASKLSILKIFGIFDGHGEFGDIVSNEIKNYFVEYFSKLNFDSNDNYEKICNNNYKEIYSLFNQIDKKLHQKYFLQNTCYNSGTTVNIIIIFKSKIISINLGDSKSILITKNSKNDNKIIILNTCHNPEREEEKKRIEENGGEVGRVNWADYGPQRVWYKGRIYPGLSISRSFGDFISEPLGVFSIPEIKEFSINLSKAKFMVVATDGIWEFLSNEKVRDIIAPYYEENNINGGINKLIEIASKMWEVKNPNYIDDLSVILVFFK
jgi:serine/threonine protein phosphatase PrpC